MAIHHYGSAPRSWNNLWRFAVAGIRTYKVILTDEDRDLSRTMLSSGKAAAREPNHARLLLHANEAIDGLRRTDQEIAAALGIGTRTVERVRQRFVEEGLESALVPRLRPRGACKIDSPRGGEDPRDRRERSAVGAEALNLTADHRSNVGVGPRRGFHRGRAAGVK